MLGSALGSRSAASSLVLLCALIAASCRLGAAKRVDYSVQPMAVSPFDTKVIDGSAAFAETFCATLPHTDGSWGACTDYLDAHVAAPAPVSSTIASPLKVMIVGGAFSECFENEQIYIYDPSIKHLKTHGVVVGPPVKIGGTDTPEANALKIANTCRTTPATTSPSAIARAPSTS
jgi:hypothetical protein